MARQVHDRDISRTLAAAEQWINTCLVEDHSLFSQSSLWTEQLVDEVYHAFVEHPDLGKDDFITKLKRQMQPASPHAQQLLTEMLWALLLFPSKMKARTKRQQVREMWALSRQQLSDDQPLIRDDVLAGIGSGGPGFNTHRPDELTFLIALTRDVKRKAISERRNIFADYDAFINWITSVPQEGLRQFRHMLRFFAFPDRVERMSSNNDRRRILAAFDIAPERDTKKWTDQQLDAALLKLRSDLTNSNPSEVMDFYAPALRALVRSTRRQPVPRRSTPWASNPGAMNIMPRINQSPYLSCFAFNSRVTAVFNSASSLSA
jgi:5-methylcytosine-specific restriction enzyme B